MQKKIILITGGSRGIGASTALLAANQGYHVCINYRNNHKAAQQLVDKIKLQGGTACMVQADISQQSEVIRLFQQMDKELGRVTALVNNAAILETQTRLEDIDAARLQRIFQTNVFGSFLCAREAIKRMSTRHGGQGGSIVNISSIAARLGAPEEYIDYAASKGAIDSMTLGLSKEVAAEGIRVNAVRPGIIDTEMHASGGEPQRVQRLAPAIPMQRGGGADEVARAIMWLLSDEASYTTGSFIDVSGGR